MPGEDNIAKMKRLKAAGMGGAPTQFAPGQNPEIAQADQHLQQLQQQRTQQLDQIPTKQKSPMVSRPVTTMKAPMSPEILDQIRQIYHLVPEKERMQILGNPSMSPETKLQQLQTIASKRDPNLFGETINEEDMMANPDFKKVVELLTKNPGMIQQAGQFIAASQGQKIPVGQLSRPPSSGMGEAKVVITKNQLIETIRKGVLIHERKQFIKNRLIKEVREQVQNKFLIENLLNEGPLNNVFEKIKAGAGKLTSKLKNPMAFDPSQAISNDQEHQKVVATRLTKIAAEASKLKQKFSQETLKNAELINQYHDTVVALFNAWRTFSDTLAGRKMQQNVMNAVGGLHDDLESEKEQLEVFLKSLAKSTATASMKHGAEQKKDRAKRTEAERESLQRAGRGYNFAPQVKSQDAAIPLVQRKQKMQMPAEQNVNKNLPSGMSQEHYDIIKNIVDDVLSKSKKPKAKSRKRK